MAIARKIAYNILFNVVAKIISTGLALVGIGFITRYLGKEGFGNYATVLAFFAFFGALADLGMYAVATREISRSDADERGIMGNVVTLRIASSFFIALLSPLIVLLLPYPQEVKMGILLVASAFFFSSSYMVLNGIFQKNLAMDKVATAELIGKMVQLGVVVLAVHYRLGFLVVIASILFCMIVNSTLVFLLSRRYLTFRLSFDFTYWKKFLRESLPVGISVFVAFVYFKADTILLSILRNSADVGIYNAAYKIIENISYFPGMIIGLILPIMSHSIFSNRRRFEDVSNKTFKLFILLVVPLVIGTFFLADDIIELIGGAGFSESALTLRILIIALACIFFGNFFNTILIAGNLQKALMKILILCAVVNVGTNLILIPLYSYTGAAVTSAMTEILVVVLTSYTVVRRLDYRPRGEHLGRIIVAGLAMGAVLFLLQDMTFIIRAVLSVLVYAVALWITRTITIREISSIISREPQIPSKEVVV
ncbi:MAG: flippase [Candidatus Moranbacteria bacterium]|nr:flippase [Candidatus Moranbacteria bacterium]